MIFSGKRKKYAAMSDDDLIRSFIEDDCVYTIPVLYERYGHLVMGSCLKYLKQTENAEDVTMRIFTELSSNLKRYQIQYFKSWLFQVTRNECLQFLKKNKPSQTQAMEHLEDTSELELEIVCENEKQYQNLEKAIESLKGEQKHCIELFYFQQKSYLQIHEELNLTLNTVKSAIQNGKRNIKIWMEQKQGENENRTLEKSTNSMRLS